MALQGEAVALLSHRLQLNLLSWSLLYLWPSVEEAPTTIHFRHAGLSLAVAVTEVCQVLSDWD